MSRCQVAPPAGEGGGGSYSHAPRGLDSLRSRGGGLQSSAQEGVSSREI